MFSKKEQKYNFIRKIGEGSTGIVYLAQKKRTEKNCAVKQIRLRDSANYAEAVLRFKQESEIASKFNHPNIIKLESFEEHKNNIHIVMEYFPGDNLKKVRESLTLREKVEAIQQVAGALHYIHQKNVVHRDIKPANILVRREDNQISVKVIDFGQAYLKNLNSQEINSTLVGSFAYISPEQSGFLKRNVDGRSDLYSLGVTFYEILTGQPPFVEADIGKLIYLHLSSVPKKPSSLNPEIPPVLDKIILKLLNKEPEERYQSAFGLKEDLSYFLNSSENPSFQIASKDKSNYFNHQIKMIGREEEFQLLKHYYKEVKNGIPRQVILAGASGAGKSKLVQEFIAKTSDENTVGASFKCDKANANIPYMPFVYLLRECLTELGFDLVKQLLQGELKEQAHILSSIFPFLEEGGTGKKQSSFAPSDKNKIISAIYSLLNALGRQKKELIFSIDDIQWADVETIELLSKFSDMSVSSHLLILLTIRDDESQGKLFQKLINSAPLIDIKLLSFEKTESYINKVLHLQKKLPQVFYEKVYQNTLGNPFFIQEMLTFLHHEEILKLNNRQWEIDLNRLDDFVLEKDVSDLIQRKLKGFDREEQLILSIAVVIGKYFDLPLLLSLSKHHYLYQKKLIEAEKLDLKRIIQIIDKARKMQLVRLEESRQGRFYSFIHDRVVESLLNQMKEDEKKALHLACAKTLEEDAGENLNDFIYEIAYHYNRTCESQKMLFYNKLAYKKAYGQYSLSNTIYYMEKIIDYNFAHKQIDSDSIQLSLNLSELLNITGKVEKGLMVLEKLLSFVKELKAPKQEINVLTQIGRGYYLLSDKKTVLKYYQQAFDIAEKTGIEIKNPHPYQLIGSMQWFTFDLKKAEYNLSKAIEYLGDDEWSKNNRLPIYGVRGWTYVLLGELNKVRGDIQVIEDGIEKMDDFINQAQTYHALSACCSWAGNPIKGLTYSLKSYEVASNSENMLFSYSSLFSRVLAYYYQQEYEKAENAIQEALKLSREHNILIGVNLFHAYHGLILLQEGRIEEAKELSLTHNNSKTEKYQGIIFNRILASYHFFYEEYKHCLEYINKGLDLFYQTGIVMEGMILLVLKKEALKEASLDYSQVEDEINEMIDKKRGSETILERGVHFVKTLLRHKKENGFYESSQSSTSIKDRLQLENVIKTSQMIASILDIDELLDKVMSKTLEVTGAERGALLLFERDRNDFDYRVLANADKDKFMVPHQLISRVLEAKKGLVLNSVQEKELSGIAESESIKSVICAPLMVKDRLTGLLYMDSKLLNNLFSREDLELLSVFTSQAAISIENARLYEKMLYNARIEQEMMFARDIQTSILPTLKDTEHYELSGFMRTATEVGGDYYDLYLKEEPYLGVFGDVSGHGLKSGLVMMMAEVAFNAYTKDASLREKDIREIYQNINLTLYDNLQERLSEKSSLASQYSAMYMTFRLFRFDALGTFEMFGSDHAEPFIVRKSGEIETLKSSGCLLGIMPEATLAHEVVRFQLNSGDTLVFCSDGVKEANKEPKHSKFIRKDVESCMFGAKQIHEHFKKNKAKKLDKIIELLIQKVDDWMASQEDDISILVIRKK